MPGSEDLDSQVARLKEGIAAAQKHRSRAEQQHAVAADRVVQVESALREEFGIGPEEVPPALEQLKADLAAETQRVRELLGQAKGEQ